MTREARISSVYQIVHNASGRRYIGSSVHTAHRWRQHKHELRAGTHHSPRLQNAWVKYGEAAFTFTVLAECFVDHTRELEQLCLDMDRPFYNVSADASHIEYTDDVRKRIGDKSVERHRHDKYDGMTLRELCEAKDVSYRCIRQRVAKGMSIDEALAVPRDIKRIGSEMRVHEYEGQMYNQAELAKLANVSVATVSRRLKAGLSVAQTVEMTPEQAKKRRADSIWSARRANERNRVQPTTIA